MFSVRRHLPVLLCLAHSLRIFSISFFRAKFFSAHDTLALILRFCTYYYPVMSQAGQGANQLAEMVEMTRSIKIKLSLRILKNQLKHALDNLLLSRQNSR